MASNLDHQWSSLGSTSPSAGRRPVPSDLEDPQALFWNERYRWQCQAMPAKWPNPGFYPRGFDLVILVHYIVLGIITRRLDPRWKVVILRAPRGRFLQPWPRITRLIVTATAEDADADAAILQILREWDWAEEEARPALTRDERRAALGKNPA